MMKKILFSIFAATAMTLSAVPFTANAIDYNGGTFGERYAGNEKYEGYIYVTKTEFFSDITYGAPFYFGKSKMMGWEDEYYQVIRISDMNDNIVFNLADGVTKDDISNILSENNIECKVGANYTANGNSIQYWQIFRETDITPNEAKVICDILKSKNLVEDFLLQYGRHMSTTFFHRTLIEGLIPKEEYENYAEYFHNIGSDYELIESEYKEYISIHVKANENVSLKEELAMAEKIYADTGLINPYFITWTANGDENAVAVDISNSVDGDANNDGETNMADAVMIMQSLANPDKYGINGTDDTHITAQGEFNGDMDGNGLTNADALEIQKMLLKIS